VVALAGNLVFAVLTVVTLDADFHYSFAGTRVHYTWCFSFLLLCHDNKIAAEP
jgi:hypothetical protein